MKRTELETILLDTVRQQAAAGAVSSLTTYTGRDERRFLKDKTNELRQYYLERLIAEAAKL